MADWVDADGVYQTDECVEVQGDVETDVRTVLQLAGALMAQPGMTLEAAIKASSSAYFALLSDAAFAQLSIRARQGSAVPPLLGLRLLGPSR